MAYDAASQTTQVFHRTSAGATLLQLDYRYDNGGNRAVMIEGGSSARTTWSYDKQNQLLGEHRTGTNAYRQTFTYDTGSNRTLKNLDTVRTTYAYDAANQLKYGQTGAARTSYVFDTTGNQKIEQPAAGARTTTTWNYENQPSQYRLSAGGSPVTMTYNGDNRRVSLVQGASTTKFVWDAPVDAYMSELDGTNAVQAIYTTDPHHYGSVLSQRRSSTSHWIHSDALGTSRVLTTTTQASSDSYLCDAWGNPVSSSGSTLNPFKWVGLYGYYSDSATGMFYVRARLYQPTVARWMSVDPIRNHDWQHPFAYVLNSPLRAIDPSGLILVAIDGTGSRQWHANPGFRLQSWVLRFFNDYLERPRRFFHGPNARLFGAAAAECQQIEDAAYTFVCRAWCDSKFDCYEHSPIDMVGHSRGGYIVMQLASRLERQGCECSDKTWAPVQVRFVGLYDPVDMAEPYADPNPVGDRLAGNVEAWAVVFAAPFRDANGVPAAVRSRDFFRRPNLAGSRGHILNVEASHGGVGGAPGEWEPGLQNWTQQQDDLGSIQADGFIRSEATIAGVRLSPR